MKVVLVLVFVLLAAATALALGSGTVATSVIDTTAAAVQMADQRGEPTTLLLSGGVLLGLAGVVKRFTA